MMQKSIYSREYRLFLQHLRRARERANLTQGELARRLGCTQSFVSKCERGERRVDVIEFWSFCRAMKLDVEAFILQLKSALRESAR